jgi:hypothetical protein
VFMEIYAGIVGVTSISIFLRKYLRKTYTYNGCMLDGVCMPPFQTKERHEKVCKTLSKDGLDKNTDVWIATYPKCGTTWCQQIVLELTRQKSEGNDPIDYHDSPWVCISLSLSLSLVLASKRHTHNAHTNIM